MAFLNHDNYDWWLPHVHCVGWRCDVQIFSAQTNGRKKKWEKGRLKVSQAVWCIGVSQLEFWFSLSLILCTSPLCDFVCERETQSVSICVCLCLMILLPFIGGCGVCGKMSVAHFHTPIVSQWVCRCGGYSSWSPFHHITDKRRCWAVEIDCCVWGETEWKHMWFAPLIFYERIQQGIVFALS